MQTVYAKKVITAQVHLNAQDCCVCGVIFAMPDDLEAVRLADGRSFYCPNGHCQHFTETEAQGLRKQTMALKSELDLAYAAQRRITEDLNAKAAEVRRLRQRAKAGVCSECHRHFINVERHMKTKHST